MSQHLPYPALRREALLDQNVVEEDLKLEGLVLDLPTKEIMILWVTSKDLRQGPSKKGIEER